MHILKQVNNYVKECWRLFLIETARYRSNTVWFLNSAVCRTRNVIMKRYWDLRGLSVTNPDLDVKSSGRVHNAVSYVQLDLTSVSAFAPVSHDHDCEEDCSLGCNKAWFYRWVTNTPHGERSYAKSYSSVIRGRSVAQAEFFICQYFLVAVFGDTMSERTSERNTLNGKDLNQAYRWRRYRTASAKYLMFAVFKDLERITTSGMWFSKTWMVIYQQNLEKLQTAC